jgi:hypothetical protein
MSEWEKIDLIKGLSVGTKRQKNRETKEVQKDGKTNSEHKSWSQKNLLKLIHKGDDITCIEESN